MSQKHDILIKEDFLEQFRSKLPDRYKLLSDDALLKLAYQHNPDIFKKYSIVNRDVINKIDDISWGTLIRGGAKQAWENWKLIPSVMGNMTSQFSNENFAFNNKFIKKYEAREGFLNFLKKTKALREALEKDPDVKKYQEWAQSNPASWGDILNKKGFNTFYNALLSSSAPFVGGIITSTITQNPIAGAAVGVAFNYMLEGQDAYSQYAQEFIEEADKMGWSHEDVANMVAAGANTYAIASSIPEFFGDVAVFKLAGLGMKSVSGIKRFSLKFAKNALKLGKEDLSKVGAQTLVDYAQENIGFGIALKAALKATGNAFLEHVAEGSTEGIQYLMEEGIQDNILNRPIDMDWLKRKVNEPEFVASVLGGAMNSVVMTAGPNLYKASGRNGTKTADRLIKYINTEVDKKSDAPQPVKDELKRFAIYKAAKSFVDNDNFNIVERIRFARRIVNNVKIKSTAESRQESATTNTQNKAEQSTQKPTDMVEDINPVANTQKTQEHTTLEKILNPNLGKVDIQGSSLNEKLIKYFVQFNDNAIKDLNSLDNKNKQKAINRLGYALEENNLNLKKDKNGNYNIDEILNKLSEMVVTEKDSGDIVDNPVAELEMQKVANKIFAEEFLGNESKEQINKLVELGVLEKDIADELLGKTVVDIEKEVAPEKHIPAEEVDWRDAYSQVKSKIRTGINKLKKVDKSLPKGLMDEYNKLGKKKTKYSEYLQLLGKTNKLLKENKLETIEQPKLKRAKSKASKPVEKTSYKKVTKSTPKEKVSNKSNIEIPEFTYKNSTEDAIALGEKYNGNKKAIEILKQKELEAKKKFDSMPKKTEEDINRRMEQSKVKQLYREAREVAEKQKETNKSRPRQSTTKTESSTTNIDRKISLLNKQIFELNDELYSLKDNQEMVGALPEDEYREQIKSIKDEINKLVKERKKLEATKHGKKITKKSPQSNIMNTEFKKFGNKKLEHNINADDFVNLLEYVVGKKLSKIRKLIKKYKTNNLRELISGLSKDEEKIFTKVLDEIDYNKNKLKKLWNVIGGPKYIYNVGGLSTRYPDTGIIFWSVSNPKIFFDIIDSKNKQIFYYEVKDDFFDKYFDHITFFGNIKKITDGKYNIRDYGWADGISIEIATTVVLDANQVYSINDLPDQPQQSTTKTEKRAETQTTITNESAQNIFHIGDIVSINGKGKYKIEEINLKQQDELSRLESGEEFSSQQELYDLIDLDTGEPEFGVPKKLLGKINQNKTQKPKPEKITVSKTYSKKDIEEELNKYIKKHDIGDIELQKETTVQNDKRLKKKILKQLQSKFPFVDIDSVDKIIDQYGGEAIAYATKMLIRYVDSKASLDTFPHEYFHIYETLFRNADFMKKAIKNVMNLLDTDEIGAREYLADYAGKYVANREKNTGILSKIKSIYKYIIANIRKLLGKYTAKDIAEIEAFKFHNIKKEKIQKAYQTYLATNTIESIIEEYQSEENKSNEDDRNGDDQEPNVKTHMDKDAGYSNIGIFIRDAGVYIPKEQYNELFKLAEQYRNKPLTNKEIRNEIVAAFREKLEELSGQKIVKRMNTAAIMSFVQKANSRVKVLREKGKWADGRLVFSIIKHTDGRISIVREADHRLDKVNQTNPAYTIEDFLEQEYRLTGIDNRVIRIPLHAIYEEHISKKSDNKYYYNIKNARKFKLTKQFVNKVNDSMGLVSLVNSKAPLLTILTSITGDNAKLLAIRVADVYKNTTRESFITNIDILIRKGLFTEELKNEILASIDTLVSQNNIRDKYIWAQELGRINWLMNVKGQRFFLREKNIMDTANRLKQDIAEGTTLVGLGDTGFMTFDPKETVMTSIDPLTGEEKEIQLINDEGKYVFDGQSLTSRGLIDRANTISGFNVLDYKTVIRYLDRYSLTKFDDNGSPISGGNVDYIQFKMMEMNPFDGTKLYMKNKDGSRGELIAEYKDNYWYDKNGNKFERLLSQEEAKDRDGKFAENYVIHKIPEEATKVKFVVKDTNHSAPFPVNGPELMLNRKLVANKVYKRLVNEIKKYYAINSKQYYTALYRAINNPDFMLAMFKKKLSDNEIPDELTDILDTTMNGKVFFHPAYINQILPVINNMFIVDGAFKVRDIYGKIGSRSRSASVLIKPKGPLDIKKNSVAFGTESKSIMNYVISQIELKDKKLYDTIKTTKNIKEKSRLINDWLKDNEVHVLIHRQPIQGYTKIQPRRIQAFIPGHGNTIFMSDYDVFRVHEADFDGDKVLVDPIHDNKELINALYDYMKEEDFKSHEYIVELGMFLKPNVSGSMANMNQALHLMDYNGRLSQSQGLIVNGKTIMTVLAYKNIEVELNNGKILKPFQPDDRVIMKDFPLDPKMVEDKTIKSIIEKNGDKIKKIGDKYYLETTKQNELSIILQMAVDNKKFGFLNRLLADKQIEFRDYVLKLLFNANINKSEMSAVRAIYNLFNYSRARRGQIGKNKSSLQQILDMSKSIAELYYDLENIKESNDKFSLEPKYLNDRNRFGELLKEKANNNINSRYSVTIKNIKAEPNITPMELLLSRLHLYDMNNQLNSNHYKESIMKHSDEIYEWANYKAVSELNQEYLDKLASGNIDQTKLSEALNLMKRIVNDFVSTLDTINSQKNKVATSEDTYSIPQSIYNEEMAKFIDRWYNAFNELDEDMKDWATLMFLSRYMFESGNRLKVARKRFKLLPFRLMGKNIFNEYMNKFYSHLDDQSVRQISTGDYKSDYVLNKFWRKICG